MKKSKIVQSLVCPKCKHDLDFLVKDQDHFLECFCCGLSFPIYEGVPIMLINEAMLLFNNQDTATVI